MTFKSLFAVGAACLLAAAPLAADDKVAGSEVTAVSVIPTPGHAELVIAISGAVQVKDFVLREPDRLVVDIVGARLKNGTAYDGIQRGGIKDVRYSQFRPDVVRVAIYLDRSRDYRLEQAGDAIRVSFGADQGFLAWSSTAPADLEPPVAPATARAPSASHQAQSSPCSSPCLATSA